MKGKVTSDNMGGNTFPYHPMPFWVFVRPICILAMNAFGESFLFGTQEKAFGKNKML